MITTVLFDIGSTILDDTQASIALLDKQKDVLRDEGYDISDGEYQAALKEIILSLSGGFLKPVAWFFTKPDINACNRIIDKTRSYSESISDRYPRKVITGIKDILEKLYDSYTLSLAANAQGIVRTLLDEHDLLKYFIYSLVSEDIGFLKPDPRFFLHYIDALKLDVEKTVMIGDRLDNDIIPAKSLGMKTILFKYGLYSIQEPRTPDEQPDFTVSSVYEIPALIQQL